MDKQLKRIRVMDTWVLYLACLISSLLINTLLEGVLGIFARILSQIIVICAVLVATKKTGQKAKNVFPTKRYSVKNAIGAAVVLAGTLLLCIPCVLLFHLIAPNFALTGYHILDLAPSAAKYFWVILLIVLCSISNCLLFDGYLFSGFKYAENKAVRFFGVAAMYAVFFGDLYVLIPLFIMEVGICFVRAYTESLKLTFIMQLFSSSAAFSLLQITAKQSSFLGENEGVAKVLGMAMIFIGVSALLLWWSTSLLGKKDTLTPFGKLMSVVIFIIFLAIGSGLVSL